MGGAGELYGAASYTETGGWVCGAGGGGYFGSILGVAVAYEVVYWGVLVTFMVLHHTRKQVGGARGTMGRARRGEGGTGGEGGAGGGNEN